MVLLLIWFLLAQASAPNAADAPRVALSPVRTVLEIESGKLKGEPWRLAWSPDGTQLYLQTIERDKAGNPSGARHFLVTLDSAKLNGTDGEPAWAADYWRWKSAQAPPGTPGDRIAVDHRTETIRSVAAPMGGALARGGAADPSAGTTIGDAVGAALQAQTASIYTLRWHGEVLGEWTNTPVIPGLTFGWAPADRMALAFSNKDGRLVLLDVRGGKKIVPDTRQSLLPAWSNDGLRIAYLEKPDKKKYTLNLVDVVR
ncbi:MAG TPA: hypothetical protein VGQ16_18240 [Vicinamibacterales bacterium]|jgi:hypothetical protein|nr:hypothetical protein [Vicinamibacterales bacterium]